MGTLTMMPRARSLLTVDGAAQRTLPRPSGDGRKKHFAVLAVGIGGSGQALDDLQAICPDLADACVAFDTDSQQESLLRRIKNRLLLSAEGNFPTILEHRDNYAYLR